eukprot:TRINITY_DN75114_c0_g1_i1.p1 TRINITY_DN75114_c0_g1~~TRINITY_DN75114_c0_g1_i1.p1  ORF type:complete len:449 (-),score=73.06 TRINITY_DN75114_c0_g1_i1:79-1353(-)
MAPKSLAEVIEGVPFNLFVDLVVFVNLAALGLEVDQFGSFPAMFTILRYCIILFYMFEMTLKIMAWRLRFLNIGNVIDLAVVIAGAIGILASSVAQGANSERLWRVTLLRIRRYWRIAKIAESWNPLVDLWLVLTSLSRSISALLWLAVILFFVLYSCGTIFTALVSPDDPTIDAHEYFGSVTRSCLTLLQLVTLDGWASSVVRPLMGSNFFAGVLLLLFVIATGYGLMSIAVGVLVFSTASLARGHSDHASHKAIKADEEIISSLRDFFEATLMIEDKDVLVLRDFQDALQLPQILLAFRRLELPVSDLTELFKHLDRRRVDAITLDEFSNGLLNLKRPASRFDVACLTANIGGSATFVTRLEKRTQNLGGELEAVSKCLNKALHELQHLATSEEGMGSVPEVNARRQGKIKMGPPVKKTRYS